MLNTSGAKMVKEMVREPFAFPGGYEKFAIADDGGILCRECCKSEFRGILHSTLHEMRDGWQVVAIDAECNCDGPLSCDHCNREIIAEPEQES